jgi:arylsulfatase I/J
VYLSGSNSYWDNTCTGWCPYTSSNKFTDLWQDALPAWGRNNSWGCTQAAQGGCIYEDDIFADFLVSGVAAHTNASQPLLTYFAPHSVHVASDPGLPLEVPDASLARFSFINDTNRRFYAAMVNTVDAQIGRLVDAYKAAGLWENTLCIISSDNGGLVYPDGHFGASNYPLKGGKQANWEGGVRSNALVSGGLIPPARRGAIETGWAAIEDWFTTLAKLAGADASDPAAKAAGLPPVDGFDLWPLLSGENCTSPRTEIWLGADDGGGHAAVQGVITADGFKALVNAGGPVDMAFWTGPLQPNGTKTPAASENCGTVDAPLCLYNVLQDPTEHVNLMAAQPAILKRLAARIAELQKGVFDPDRGDPDPLACNFTATRWRGFVGPFWGPLP